MSPRMSYRLRRPIVASALLLLLAVSAGCLGLTGGSELPESDAVTESLGSVEAVEGTLHYEQRVGNETTELQMEFVQRMTTGEFRATVHQSSPDVNVEMVSNGSRMWVYNRTENTVRTVDLEGVRTDWNESVAAVADIFASLNQSSDNEDVSISPLPAVPGGGDGSGTGAVGVGSLPDVGNISLTYQGTSDAAGQRAHAVSFQPQSNESLITNGTLWFDSDRYFPIKTQYSASIDGRPSEMTTEYRNLTYNPSIPEGTFTFEPPANATIEDGTESVSVFQSRSELERATDRSVPDPDLPEGYGFAEGTLVQADGNTTLTLRYADGEESLAISKRTPPRESAAANGSTGNETVDIDGNEGQFRTVGQATALSWECGGSQYTVAGQLSNEELHDIAESIACE